MLIILKLYFPVLFFIIILLFLFSVLLWISLNHHVPYETYYIKIHNYMVIIQTSVCANVIPYSFVIEILNRIIFFDFAYQN